MQRPARARRRRPENSAGHARTLSFLPTLRHWLLRLDVAILKASRQPTFRTCRSLQRLLNRCQRYTLHPLYAMAFRTSCVGTRRAGRHPQSVHILTPSHMAPNLRPAPVTSTHSVQVLPLTHLRSPNSPRITFMFHHCGRCSPLNLA